MSRRKKKSKKFDTFTEAQFQEIRTEFTARHVEASQAITNAMDTLREACGGDDKKLGELVIVNFSWRMFLEGIQLGHSKAVGMEYKLN